MSFKKNISGYTIIELLIVIGMISIIASIVALNFSSNRNQKSLSIALDETTSLINEARTDTLEGSSGSVYGVHFETSRAVLFKGSSFIDGTSGNKIISFDPSVSMSSIVLAGGGSNIFFKKLTGDTDQYGTLVIQQADGSMSKTITIAQTGLVSSN